MKRSPSDTASITVTAGDVMSVYKNTTLTALKPINDTAKTPSVALTALKHFLYFLINFSRFCLSDSNRWIPLTV